LEGSGAELRRRMNANRRYHLSRRAIGGQSTLSAGGLGNRALIRGRAHSAANQPGAFGNCIGAFCQCPPIRGRQRWAQAPRKHPCMSQTTLSSAQRTTSTTTYEAKVYAAASASPALAPTTIRRRNLLARDVQIDVLFCGVCHSDLHEARNEWRSSMPTVDPCVPAHEILGRVVRAATFDGTDGARSTRLETECQRVGSTVRMDPVNPLPIGRPRLPVRRQPPCRCSLCFRSVFPTPSRSPTRGAPGAWALDSRTNSAAMESGIDASTRMSRGPTRPREMR
jgi:hypothetical protein